MRFFIGIICGLAAMAGVYFVVYWYSPFRATSSVVETVVGLYGIKESCLAASLPPRIILLSGSNGLYGVGMEQIEKETGHRAVNLATVGLISLDYHFYVARKFLRSGDIVILALEYHYYNPPSTNPTNSAVILRRDRGYFLQLSMLEKFQWIFGEPLPMLVNKLWEPDGRVVEVENKCEEIIRDSINSHGDFIGHRKAKQTPEQKKNVLSSRAIDIAKIVAEKHDDRSWAMIAQFAVWCRANGVTLLATFPSTVYFPDYDAPEVAASLERLRDKYREIGIPTLGTPKTFMWEHADFFDTNYHLTEESKERRTSLLIQFLKPFLGNGGPSSDRPSYPSNAND